MGTRSRTVEEVIAGIARAAHGVVTRAELLTAGITVKEIAHRVRKGALIPQYPGVYRAGHCAPSREATYLAAVRAGGPGAVLYGNPAGHLLAILKGPSWPPPEVLTTTERKPKGLRTRRTRSIDRRDVTEVHGIPVTTVPRTLVDLAATLNEEELARAVHLAGVIYRVTPDHIERVLRRRPRAKGAAKLKRIARGETKVLLSKLEKGFVARLTEEGLPLPETNRLTDGHYVDCRWRGKRVTVELDGFRFHNSRHAWEDGLRRERKARKRGDKHRRYTYADVFEDPTEMLAELRELLV